MAPSTCADSLEAARDAVDREERKPGELRAVEIRRRSRFDALEWQSSLPGARFKAYRSGGKQIRLVEFTSEFIEPHWCEKGHIGLILEGSLEVDFRGNVVIYHKAEGIFISPGPDCAHKVRSLTPVVRLVLVEDV